MKSIREIQCFLSPSEFNGVYFLLLSSLFHIYTPQCLPIIFMYLLDLNFNLLLIKTLSISLVDERGVESVGEIKRIVDTK